MRTIASEAPDALQEAVRVLDAGGMAVIPTDTHYALAADALVEEAVEAAFLLKNRPADRPLPVCVGGLEDIHHVAFLTPVARSLAQRWWPGPLTLVLRARPALPEVLVSGGDTVAVRVPLHPFALGLARQFGAITLTSAKLHGAQAPETVAHARDAFGARVGLYVDGGRSSGEPSTLVDATGTEAKVLRTGRVAAAEIVAHGTRTS